MRSFCLLYGLFLFSYGQEELPSACANGYPNDLYGFPCPQMMLLSEEWMVMAKKDGFSSNEMLYGVAGSNSDQDCGKCFQLRVLDAERQWRPDFPLLVLQIFNSGYDVYPYQFDVYMGGGGFGYFTACNTDCRSRFCQGGSCFGSMYSEGTFKDWTNAKHPDPNPCYSGGVKWLEDPPQPHCQKIAPIDSRTYQSCVRTNEQGFHQNFVSLVTERVQCPPGIYALTGLRRKDDESLPLPSLSLPLSLQCQGDRSQGRFCMTTMQDCCKPSCSWKNKGDFFPSLSYLRYCFANESFVEL